MTATSGWCVVDCTDADTFQVSAARFFTAREEAYAKFEEWVKDADPEAWDTDIAMGFDAGHYIVGAGYIGVVSCSV